MKSESIETYSLENDTVRSSNKAARLDNEDSGWKVLAGVVGAVIVFLTALSLSATGFLCDNTGFFCPLGPPYTVTGVVTDHNSMPLIGLKVVSIGHGSITDTTYTDSTGRYHVSVTGSTIEPSMVYSPDGSKEAVRLYFFDSAQYAYNTVADIAKQSRAVSNTTRSADFSFNGVYGSLVYPGFKKSYDYWDGKNEAEDIRGFLNSSVTTRAHYCGAEDVSWLSKTCKQRNDIHFNVSYQFEDAASHEYGHSISDGWGLPGGHEEQPNPIEEAWADFNMALVKNNPKIGYPFDFVDLRTARNESDIMANYTWWREWALAGVMWDLEQIKRNSAYETLKQNNHDNRNKTSKYDFSTIRNFYLGYIDINNDTNPADVCKAFTNHGFVGVC